MFIEVMKVSNAKRKAEDGSDVKDPHSKSSVDDNKLVIHREMIRIDEIRSARPWDKDTNQEAYIDGPMIKVFLVGDKTRSSRPEMLINESLDSFMERIKAIPNG